jgi:hypothetical protein
MSQRIVRTIFFVIFAAALTCCPLLASSKTASSTVGRASTPGDAQLQAVISAKLAKSKIGKDGFKFHVQRGVVTWEGTTNIMQHKGSATRMARTAGALQVVNNIKVSTAGKEKAAGNLKKAQVSD